MADTNPVLHLIEKARQAQQVHEQKQAVQLEIPDWRDDDDSDEFGSGENSPDGR